MEAVTKVEKVPRPCKVPGCGRLGVDGQKGASGGYCGMHYRRTLRKKTPGGAEKQRSPAFSANARIWMEPELYERMVAASEFVHGEGQVLSMWARHALEAAVVKVEAKMARAAEKKAQPRKAKK